MVCMNLLNSPSPYDLCSSRGSIRAALDSLHTYNDPANMALVRPCGWARISIQNVTYIVVRPTTCMERVTRARLYHAWTWGTDMRPQGVAFMQQSLACHAPRGRSLSAKKKVAVGGHFSTPFDGPGTILGVLGFPNTPSGQWYQQFVAMATKKNHPFHRLVKRSKIKQHTCHS